MTAGRIALVVGTRPEIIKMAEIAHLLGDRALIIHSGQHWDNAMSGRFLKDLGVPEPTLALEVGGRSRGQQIARTLSSLDDALHELKPAAVVVQGDTNTAAGAALAANAREVLLVHVEAGLRSHDRTMPEEHNRVLIDHLADLCLAPTPESRENLLAEGIADERIAVTGNTVVGAVSRALAIGEAAAQATQRRLGLLPGGYIMATIHRPENTDSPEQLTAVLAALGELADDTPVLLPLHPRTRSKLGEFGLSSLLAPLVVLEPLGYEEFVALCVGAAVTVSDSGGVQEEASVWKRPVAVVRRSTERPEVLGTFAHLTEAGTPLVLLVRELLANGDRLRDELGQLPSPYGDRHAAHRCVEAIEQMIHQREPGECDH